MILSGIKTMRISIFRSILLLKKVYILNCLERMLFKQPGLMGRKRTAPPLLRYYVKDFQITEFSLTFIVLLNSQLKQCLDSSAPLPAPHSHMLLLL